jgi:hypothetical protein
MYITTIAMKRELNIGALPIARDEYLSQLVSFLQPLISKGFLSIYQDARKKCSKEDRKNERFRDFQMFVKKIPSWSSLMVEEETRRIKEKVDCLSELITVIFVGNVKILASIRLKGNNKNIKVKIPSCNNFIHTVYINTAKRVFYNPMLFDHTCSSIEGDKNTEMVYEYIEKAVVDTIRQMLPIKNILDEYLGHVFDDEVECNDDDGEDNASDDGDGESFYGNQIGSDSEDEADNVIKFSSKIPKVEQGGLSGDASDSGEEEASDDNEDNEDNEDDDNEDASDDDDNEDNEDNEYSPPTAPAASEYVPPTAPAVSEYVPVVAPAAGEYAPPTAPVAAPVAAPRFDFSSFKETSAPGNESLRKFF